MCWSLSGRVLFSIVTSLSLCVCVLLLRPLLWQPPLLSMTHTLTRELSHAPSHALTAGVRAHPFARSCGAHFLEMHLNAFKPPTLDYMLFISQSKLIYLILL